jgi:homoserine O-succinyltransferase/O-acetyltransferase
VPITRQLSGSGRFGDELIVIGLVNNMPDAALRATERQFHDLLDAASGNRLISLRYFSMPELPRSAAAQSHISQSYEDLNELWSSHLDGLIVTGTEPRAAALTDEPYWPTLTKLVDWSEDHTFSTVWSCLAAHAAVAHNDGIERQRLTKKLSGVFDCAKVTKHKIVAGAPSSWSVPHSRYNDLPSDELTACGYQVLSSSAATGADLFIKMGNSLKVFVQGHPEYEAETLLREYRRDVGRYLTSDITSYPEMPSGYFRGDAIAALTEFQQEALVNRSAKLLDKFPLKRAEAGINYTWRDTAVRIYANWLTYIANCRCTGVVANRLTA